jgi:hypothetical protein
MREVPSTIGLMRGASRVLLNSMRSQAIQAALKDLPDKFPDGFFLIAGHSVETLVFIVRHGKWNKMPDAMEIRAFRFAPIYVIGCVVCQPEFCDFFFSFQLWRRLTCSVSHIFSFLYDLLDAWKSV